MRPQVWPPEEERKEQLSSTPAVSFALCVSAGASSENFFFSCLLCDVAAGRRRPHSGGTRPSARLTHDAFSGPQKREQQPVGRSQ